MFPWLLHTPPITTYGAMIVLAIVAGWLLARRNAKRASVDASHVDLLIPAVVAAGLAGAYAFGWLTDALTEEAAHGVVLLGSLVIGTMAGIAYAVIARIRLGQLGDVVAPALALGVGIGRIGCFFAGCCFGQVCEHAWAMPVRFPAGSFAWHAQVTAGQIGQGAAWSLPVYPTQLYESALCLMLAAWLQFERKRRGTVAGERFLTFGIAYALIRFGIEFLRADNPAIQMLTFSQWVCVTVPIVAMATWFWRRKMLPPVGMQL